MVTDADQIRREQAHVAGAAADVEHAHTRPEASAPQRTARDVGEKGALLRQPRQLVRRNARGRIAAALGACDQTSQRQRPRFAHQIAAEAVMRRRPDEAEAGLLVEAPRRMEVALRP